MLRIFAVDTNSDNKNNKCHQLRNLSGRYCNVGSTYLVPCTQYPVPIGILYSPFDGTRPFYFSSNGVLFYVFYFISAGKLYMGEMMCLSYNIRCAQMEHFVLQYRVQIHSRKNNNNTVQCLFQCSCVIYFISVFKKTSRDAMIKLTLIIPIVSTCVLV